MNPQELLRLAQHVTLALPQDPTDEERQAACLLLAVCNKLGKQLSLRGDGFPPQLRRAENGEGRTFTVTLRGLANVISKIHYEKRGRDVRLFFTLKGGEFSASNIALESDEPSNLVVIVGNNGRRHNLALEENISSLQATPEFVEQAVGELSKEEGQVARQAANFLWRSAELAEGTVASALEDRDVTELGAKGVARALKDLSALEPTLSWLAAFPEQSVTKVLLWSRDQRAHERARAQLGGESRNEWTLLTSPLPPRETIDRLS